MQRRLRPAYRRAAALTLAVCLLAATGVAAQTGARLRFDFAAGVVEVATSASHARADLPFGLGSRMAAFRASLARGNYDRDEAASLGHALLSPVAEELRDTTQWEITPPEAAPVGALLAPWDPERALLHAVTIWYRPAGVDSRKLEPMGQAPPAGDGRGVLSLAPFRAVADPRSDSPDTLLAVFRATAKTLDQVPRNDVTVESITGALRDHQYALVWLRADPSQVPPLLAPLSHGTHVLWWSRPLHAEGTAERSVEAALEPAERWTVGEEPCWSTCGPAGKQPWPQESRPWSKSWRSRRPGRMRWRRVAGPWLRRPNLRPATGRAGFSSGTDNAPKRGRSRVGCSDGFDDEHPFESRG